MTSPQQRCYLKRYYAIDEDQLKRLVADRASLTFAIENVVAEVRGCPIDCTGCASHSSAQSEQEIREKVLDEVIHCIELMIDAEQKKGEDGAYSLDGHIKLGILAHVSNSVKKLRSKQGEQEAQR